MPRHLLLLAALLALAACRGASDEPPVLPFQNVSEAVAYVGDEACASCHEDLAARYRSHGMARSFYRWTPAVRVEPAMAAPIEHAATGLRYRVVEDGDGLAQEETAPSPDGAIVHRLRRRIDFVMGSGNAARTYFTEENGRLFQLPLTWYTQADGGAGRWDFSPGYAEANGRFGRLVPDRCMACHNAYPEPVPHAEGKYAALPEGIGCERCHGPGALHVEARLAEPEPADSVDLTIVNPARLPFERRLDVCQQCHLHTTVSVLREGEHAFSYRPSQPLAGHVAFFAAEDATDPAAVSVVSHADRLRRSPCFTETPGALACTTCHDPHEGFREAGPAYFTRTCLGCHAPEPLRAAVPPALLAEHAPEADCASCHMPKMEAEDAPHASFTDHHIRVVRAGERSVQPAMARGRERGLEPYFERDAGTAEGQRYEGMAAVVHGSQTGDPEALAYGASLLERSLRADSTHGEAHFLLGVALQRLGEVERAIPPLERAARAEPDVPQRLQALARAYEAAHRSPADVERLYRRALAIQPALAEVRVDFGRFLQAQGRRAEALDAFHDARSEQPSLDAAAFHEGLVLAELGRRAEAEAALVEAVRLDPANAGLVANLIVVRADDARAIGVEPFLNGAGATAFGLPVTRHVAAGADGSVGFPGLPAGAVVRVFTADGVPLRTLEPRAGGPRWDLRTDAGRLAASGVYLAHVRVPGARPDTRVVRFALAIVPAAAPGETSEGPR